MAQSLPPSAREYARAQAQEISNALGGVGFAWRQMTDDLDLSWRRVAPDVQAVMDEAQRRIVSGARVYIPTVLADTNPAALAERPEYLFAPESIIGTSGDGLGTDTLAYEAVIRTKVAIGNGATVSSALDSGGKFLLTAVGTMLSDTGRTVEKVESVGRGSTTFVRMLVPPSCGRCVILAGQVTHAQTAFLRHPKCDCRNIPAAEDVADELRTNTHGYLEGMGDKALTKALGSKANAQAWRDGADPSQLINAYRKSGDVRSAQQFGHTIKFTTEGTTSRGAAYRRMSAMRAHQAAQTEAGYAIRNTRNGPELRLTHATRGRQPRLMPESIYQIATDPADAQRLLRLYGWIL